MYGKIDKEKCFVKIETMVSKYMWEMRKGNKDVEEEDSEYKTRRKKGQQCREGKRKSQLHIPETMNEKEEEEEGREETYCKFERESHQNTPNPLSPTNTPTSDQPENASTLETQSQPEGDTQHRSNHHTQTVSNRNAKNDEKG